MTTSEGGIVTTIHKDVFDRCNLLRAHGMPVRYHHDSLGFNFRLTDIAAAIGLEQLKKLEGFNEARIRNAKLLTKGLSEIEGIVTPRIYPERRHVFHQYTIRLHGFPLTRDDVIKKLNEAQVGSMVYYPIPVHKQKLYRDLGYRDAIPVTEQFSAEVLSLPVHPSVTESDVDRIVSAFRSMRA